MASRKKRELPYGLLAMAAAAGLLWQGLDYVGANLRQVPVKAVPPPAATATMLNAQSLYPVLVRHEGAATPDKSMPSIDSLFVAKPANRSAVPQLPALDIGAIVMAQARVDGLTAQGAFINGRFYRIGEPIEALAVHDGKAIMVPVLQALGQDTVELAGGGRKFRLHLSPA